MMQKALLIAAVAAAIPAFAMAQQGRPANTPQSQKQKVAEEAKRGQEMAEQKGKSAEKRAENAPQSMNAGYYALGTCPVSGEPLGEDAVVKVYDGREVRFCCADCPERFEADMELMMATMDARIIAQQKWDYPLEICPVSGHGLDEGGEPVEMVYGTRYVKLCCDGCIEDFKANAAEYFETIDAAIADAQRDDYPLDTCVISGEPLGSMGDPVEIVIGTTLVRLCCKGCLPKVAKAPWKAVQQVQAAR
jgi:hypothetical protein